MPRPTKYNDEILKKTVAYIASCEDDLKNRIVNLPSIEGLSYEIGVRRNTIYDWCKQHEEFSNIIEDLLAKQAKVLLSNGLAGTYNPTITKLILSKHGFREGLDVTTNDKDITINTSDPALLALAKKYEEEIKNNL